MLEARDLSFRYPHSRWLFEQFNLQVQSRERVSVEAPSGVGKTTLCRLLAGYEKPTAGQVLVDGNPLPKHGLCPVQMISQHPEHALDPRMRLGDSLFEAGEVSQEIQDDLGIQKKWLSRYPHELSGGEMQRFCIARAIATNPRYLIADEISTMLDAYTQALIWTYLLDVVEKQEMGLIFVSHSPALTSRIATRHVPLTKLG